MSIQVAGNVGEAGLELGAFRKAVVTQVGEDAGDVSMSGLVGDFLDHGVVEATASKRPC